MYNLNVTIAKRNGTIETLSFTFYGLEATEFNANMWRKTRGATVKVVAA